MICRTGDPTMYGMTTKLTLRMDTKHIRLAKQQAKRRGKSVSQMVGEFFESLDSKEPTPKVMGKLPPITASLMGVLKDSELSEADYKNYLVEKYA